MGDRFLFFQKMKSETASPLAIVIIVILIPIPLKRSHIPDYIAYGNPVKWTAWEHRLD